MGEPTSTSSERKSTTLPEVWSYEYFREYLLSLTRPNRSEFVLPQDQFPKEIDLNKGWHQTLNQMRRESGGDMLERFAGIGFKEDRRGLYLPISPAKGMSERVSPEVISKELDRMRARLGIISIVGDLHSHPRILGENPPTSSSDNALEGAFSVGDIYRGVVKLSYFPLIMGVVEGYENIFVFRSKESSKEDIDPLIMSQENFERYWYEKNGYMYLGNIKANGANRAQPVFLNAKSHWNINQQIAQKHRLVLYKGIENGPLIRIFPPKAA